MNITNTAPLTQGSAAHAGGVTAQKSPEGTGLTDLFAALLASMQATEPQPVEAAVAATVIPCEDCEEAVAPKDSMGENADDPAMLAGNVVPATASPLMLVAAVTKPLDSQLVDAGGPPPQAGTTPVVSKPVNSAVGDAALDVTQPAMAPVTGETVAIPELPGNTAMKGEPLPVFVAPAKPDATSRGNGLGAIVVEAVREGRTLAASTEDVAVRTIRDLVQDAIMGARERAQSMVVNPAPSNGDPAAPAEMTVATTKPTADTVPEFRPAPTDPSPKPATHLALNAVAASGGGGESAGSVMTAPHRESGRASLPQSVDVRDVGEFTVRSVRYLSGNTEDTVTVRLIPRSLGELHVAIRTAAEGLEVVLTATGSAVRDRLEGQLVGLRDALAREGLDVTRVTVQTQPTFDLSGQMSSHQHQQSQTGHTQRFSAPAFHEPEPNPSESQQQSRPGRPQHEGGLNMLA